MAYPYSSKYPPRPSVPKSSLNTICQRKKIIATCLSLWHITYFEIENDQRLQHFEVTMYNYASIGEKWHLNPRILTLEMVVTEILNGTLI